MNNLKVLLVPVIGILFSACTIIDYVDGGAINNHFDESTANNAEAYARAGNCQKATYIILNHLKIHTPTSEKVAKRYNDTLVGCSAKGMFEKWKMEQRY